MVGEQDPHQLTLGLVTMIPKKKVVVKSTASLKVVLDMGTSRTTKQRKLDQDITKPMTLLPESHRELFNSDKRVAKKG